ncbi:unnamed protein product, partial [Sphagnum compactum]
RFVQAMDLPPQDLANYEIVIHVDGSVDRRRYNAPTSSEVVGLMPANDRPDLTSRVFNMKLNALLKDLLQNGVLGTTV